MCRKEESDESEDPKSNVEVSKEKKKTIRERIVLTKKVVPRPNSELPEDEDRPDGKQSETPEEKSEKPVTIQSAVKEFIECVRSNKIKNDVPRDPAQRESIPSAIIHFVRRVAAETSSKFREHVQSQSGRDRLKCELKQMYNKSHNKVTRIMSGESSAPSSRRMIYPYTLSAKIAQFPYKFHIEKSWTSRYYLVALAVCFPVFYKISKLANNPENVRKWDEIRRRDLTPGAHH